MTTAFDLLHRDVQRKLWDMNWTELRSIQDQAIRHLLLGGGDAVISSPTASGKTEAAFLPVLSAIADSPMGSVRAMYIGPLKALINDQFRRVEDLCQRLEMPVCKWHGDVGDGAKHHLLAAPGGILLITPESLEAMLVRRPTTMPRLFGRLSFVVVDEMHAFMGTERGAQLISQFHRLNARAGCDPIRIGLSATLGDPESALKWLRPGGPPAKLIDDATARSSIQIRLRGLWRRRHAESGDATTKAAEEDDDPVSRELARAILVACSGKTNLVFANAKSRIEVLADALTTEVTEAKLTDEIVVHHGSLSRERRLHAEERLREAQACTAVCSNTLELGIDIGGIDEVVQVSAPWSVSSLVQRVGRSGRREGAPRVLRGFFVEQAPDEESDVWDRLHLDLVQGIATVELMLEKFIEPPTLGRAHLSTLVHQSLAFLAETGGSTALTLFQRVVGSGAFGTVAPADFAAMLRELGRVDLVEQMGDGSLILGLAGQKIVEHYTFFAAFNAPEELRVVHGAEEIGAIAMPPAPGEHLILAGRRWRVESIDADRREVLVSPARGRRPPTFSPSRAAVHAAVHAKMSVLLRGEAKPTYLDSVALEILASARVEAARHNGFRPPAQAFDVGVRLFVFGGSRVQQTLSLVLSRAGLDTADQDVGFDVDADVSRVTAALRAFASKPDLLLLAEHADRVLLRRELGREKFDPFVAPEVWRRAYAREELDERGAVSAALALADALTTRTPSVSFPIGGPSTLLSASSAIPLAPIRQLSGPPPEHAGGSLSFGDLSDFCEALTSLPVSASLPVRAALVPNEAHAHALRRELARSGRTSLLAGTRCLSITQLAREILHGAGVTFECGEEGMRAARLRGVFREPPPLRYFSANQLRDTPGWDRAFARTIGDLEAGALTPELLAGCAEDPRARDVADVWAALDRIAGSSWTRARIVREAARALARDPSILPQDGPTLIAFTGHEPRVDFDLAHAIPGATLATWAARPRRPSHIERLHASLGANAAHAWEVCRVPPESTRELDLLKTYLFEDPSITGDVARPRSQGRDETVEIEQHEGIDAEIDAALTWVQLEITRHATPLEEIALLLPRLDPVGGMLFDRLADLNVAAHVVGGLPALRAPVCARLLALLRALSASLHRDALVDLFPSVRIAREPRAHLSRSECIEAFGALGILGGTRGQPEDGLKWPERIRDRVATLASALSRLRNGGEREEEARRLERLLGIVRLLEEPMVLLTRAAEPFVRNAPVVDLWPPLESFLREHAIATGDGKRLVELFSAAMQSACSQPAIASLAGTDAHDFLEETLLGLRLESGRFGDPAVTVATIQDVAGIPFAAVRILGVAEGMLPSSPREDPVLPDEQRRCLGAGVLRARSDHMLAQLHALDRVVRNVSGRFVLSAPKRDLDGTYRELSSVGIEAAVALGRGGVPVPDAHHLHRVAFAPAHDALEQMRDASPLREATWQVRAARRREVPARWAPGSHLDLARGRSLLDPTRGPGPLDGIFPDGGWFPLVPGLAAERPLSASRWRTFLECPHRFFLEVILKLGAPPAAQDAGALDALTYGSLFHTVAERFYSAHGDAFLKRARDVDFFESHAQAIADVAFAECLEGYALAGVAVRAAQRERLRRDVRALLEIDWDLERERVVAVERAFGTSVPMSLAVGDHLVYVRGYIDRIDVEQGTAVLRDLKTGKAKPRKADEIDPAIDAQLGLYALVARTMKKAWALPGGMAAAYVYPSGVRHTERAFRGADYDRLQEDASGWLQTTTELAVARRFPRTPNAADCTYCPFTPVCGPNAEKRAAAVLDAAADLVSIRKLKAQ